MIQIYPDVVYHVLTNSQAFQRETNKLGLLKRRGCADLGMATCCSTYCYCSYCYTISVCQAFVLVQVINSKDGRDRIEQLVERNILFFHSVNATRIFCLPIVPFVHSRCYGTNSKIKCAQSFLFGACGIQKYTDTAILKNVVLVCSWQAHK